ncbi:MHFG family PEP-CTERM protein [Duganella sp.]|uniref:MHFG family PEP-CTERM protein n=1 Tax=Duganella sp. TaxID=1904440 RepID=UPI0031DE3241
MPLLLAVTLAAATVQPACSWDNPGHNPYTGGAAAAIDRYTDIPEAVRSTLKRRMEEGQSDDKVSITRGTIAGKYQYDPAIRDMHFGKSSVCATVTRDKWAETRVEPGAVYCVDKHCILVPRICGNVSRVNRTPAAAAAAAAAPEKQEDRELHIPGELADLGLEDPNMMDDNPLTAQELAERRAAAERVLAAMGDADLEAEQLAALLAADRDMSRLRPGVFSGQDGEGPSPAAPVPEADTWAMLLAGLGLVGWQARRRARKAAQ